jgi:uncharacterized NAD-dependent epimerase/dehydratase family protein
VTLGLLHGSCPNAMVLCHQATRTHISEYRSKEWLPIPPLSDYVRLYETIASAVWPSRVVGICLNTYDLDDQAALEACQAAQRETGLPCTDPVRFPDDPSVVNALVEARQRYLATGRC